ncbi:hypothetical protein ACU4GD_27360 [Cupriavidus basilensis]
MRGAGCARAAGGLRAVRHGAGRNRLRRLRGGAAGAAAALPLLRPPLGAPRGRAMRRSAANAAMNRRRSMPPSRSATTPARRTARCWRWKFGGVLPLADWLAGELASRWRGRYAHVRTQDAARCAGADSAVPAAAGGTLASTLGLGNCAATGTVPSDMRARPVRRWTRLR